MEIEVDSLGFQKLCSCNLGAMSRESISLATGCLPPSEATGQADVHVQLH